MTLEPLTVNDRCDADAAGIERALVRVVSPSGREELLLCHHHFTAVEIALLGGFGWKVTEDIRDQVLRPELKAAKVKTSTKKEK